MNDALQWLVFVFFIAIMPSLAVGIMRKIKARLQNRRGAPLVQPLFDLYKLFQKGEVLSSLASWIFRSAVSIQFVTTIMIAFLVPWTSIKPDIAGGDLFLIVYLLALIRLVGALSSLDAGSVFCGFGASREVTVAVLIEPVVVLCLASLASIAHTSDMSLIFSFSCGALRHETPLWILCGAGLFLASLVELSRMPIDDPTTHLELTMIHEATIIENSGRNLGLIDYSHNLKLVVLLGLTGQCFLHAVEFVWTAEPIVRAVTSLTFLFCILLALALVEATSVKIRWSQIPQFVAYAVVISVICTFVAIWRT